MPSVLIFGRGWIGNHFKEFYSNTSYISYLTEVNIADRLAVQVTLEEFKPDIVINAAGKTGRPNIDWCETHTQATFKSNVIGPSVLFDECLKRNIFFVHLSSGCIFNGPSSMSGGFVETDKPNPLSFYARTKVWAEQLLQVADQASNQKLLLIPRIRMPIDGTPSKRNLITKLVGYPQIISVINSVTVIPSLLMATNALIRKRKTGIYHVANPEPITHTEILELYKEYVDPMHTYELIPEADLLSRGLVKAHRSNCILDTSKLQKEGIGLFPTRDAIIMCLKNYAKNQVK